MKLCIVCKEVLTKTQNKYCSSNCKAKGHYLKIKSQQNTTWSQYRRGYLRKLYLMSLHDYKCKNCGYNKNMSALQFHHIDGKDFSLDSRKLANTSLDKILEEAKKCVLLCANCHAEEHNPNLLVENMLIEYNGDLKKLINKYE